eukprot:scaffold346_cov347-Pavlova_lutheri.AAC.4
MDSYSSMERSRAASQAPPQPPRQLPPYRRSSRARSFPPSTLPTLTIGWIILVVAKRSWLMWNHGEYQGATLLFLACLVRNMEYPRL